MPRFLLTLALVLATCVSTLGEDIGDGRTGVELVTFLRSNFRPTTTLTYKQARQKMFAEIDNQDGRVRCVYTGVEIPTSTIPPGSTMNTEHTWPQSKFNQKLPMKSDLFHLFPTLSRVNGERGNNPFGDIPDAATEDWWRSDSSEPEPAGQRDSYSESVDDLFEPREDHKGNVARAMLYFWVIYGDKNISRNFIDSQLTTLQSWHNVDPADETERQRDTAIFAVQGNHNPFILDPTLASRVTGIDSGDLPPAPARPAPPDVVDQPISIRIAGWNMQSTMNSERPESDPEHLAGLMGAKQGIHLWGLSEVENAEALRSFEAGAEEGEDADFVGVLGKTGGSDRLAVLYDRAIFEQLGEPVELKDETQLSRGLRASLLVKLRGRRSGQEFFFLVNHLKRGGEQNETRLQQAENLNAWARTQRLPVIAVGDFNFDFDPELGDLGVPHRDGGFDALTKDRVFEWIRPQRLVKTQASDEFNSVLDFIFVANAPFGWTGTSRILDQQGDQIATENDFEDDEETTDHRPVDAILILNRTAPAPPPPDGGGTQPGLPSNGKLVIGAWNIEHLGRSGDNTDPAHVADYIIGSNVAALALEEIYDTDGEDSKRTNAKLDAALQQIEAKTGQRWAYRLFPKSTHELASEQTKQLTGIAWNTSRLQISGEPLLLPVAHGEARPNDFWRRQPHAVKFTTTSDKTDFVVIPVHMRSNSSASGQTVKPKELRAKEVESLLAHLDEVREHFDDEDIIILGDTNVLSAAEAAVTGLVGAGFRDLNPDDMKTWMNKGVRKSPFDRFFVPEDQSEFAESTQEAVLSFPAQMNAKAFDRDVSDHVMIRTTIMLSEDDD